MSYCNAIHDRGSFSKSSCSKLEICGFEHIHRHSLYSQLDGMSDPEDLAKRSREINQRYLCITDHGSLGVIPRQIRACEENDLEPIFGIELYYNPWQPRLENEQDRKKFVKDLNDEEKARYRKNYHLLAIAFNETGYKNLIKLSSWSYLCGWGGRPARPRVNTEMLEKHKEGIIFTSCCYASEIGQTFDSLGKDAAFDKVIEYKERFGENFFLEIMMLDFDKQRPYDKFILEAHDRFHIPIELAQDCHYTNRGDSHFQRLMLMVQTGRTLKQLEAMKQADETKDFFELQDQQLWMKSEEELNEFWETSYSDIIDYDLFKLAKSNTIRICEKAKGVKLDRSNKLPVFPDADERLRELILKGFRERNLPIESRYTQQLQTEYELIKRKCFSSYFLIEKMAVDEARRVFPKLVGWGDGNEAVSCGRGSAVGSLICYCLGITDVDPLKHDLLFSRFLNEARGGRSMKLRFVNIDPVPVEDMDRD